MDSDAHLGCSPQLAGTQNRFPHTNVDEEEEDINDGGGDDVDYRFDDDRNCDDDDDDDDNDDDDWAGLGPQENECQHFECFHQGTAPRSITFDHKDHHDDYYEDKRGVDLTEPLKILALPRLV